MTPEPVGGKSATFDVMHRLARRLFDATGCRPKVHWRYLFEAFPFQSPPGQFSTGKVIRIIATWLKALFKTC